MAENLIPWHEMDVDGELALRCQDPLCREVGQELRRALYRWRHLPVDTVVEPGFTCPKAVQDTGIDLEEEVDVVRTDVASDIISRHLHARLRDEGDLELIRAPEVTYDAEATERNYGGLVELKDISTARYRPQRLWEWAQVAARVSAEFA